jgi:excisionase family DNA binding protein
MENKVYNLIGLSERLRLPAKWLKQQADAGEIPCLKVGRKRLFNFDAVQEALSRLAAKGDNKHGK